MRLHRYLRSRFSKGSPPPFAEAAALQQRGERAKAGALSEPLFAEAAARFAAALAHFPASCESRSEAAIGLGECLQKQAEAGLGRVRSAPLSTTLLAEEAAAVAAAAALCAKSLHAFSFVTDDAAAAAAARGDAFANRRGERRLLLLCSFFF